MGNYGEYGLQQSFRIGPGMKNQVENKCRNIVKIIKLSNDLRYSLDNPKVQDLIRNL